MSPDSSAGPPPVLPVDGRGRRVFMVEDVTFYRHLLRGELARLGDWQLVGEADNATAAMAHLDRHPVDLLMVDIGLRPPGDGFTVVAHVRRTQPQTRVLVFTVHLNEYIVAQCHRFGVQGFFNKETTAPDQLGPVLATLAAGLRSFPPDFLEARDRWQADAHAVSKRLTERENEVLHLIALGRSDPEIAAALGISVATATTHRSAILRKLGQPTTAKLTVHAISHGYGRLSY